MVVTGGAGFIGSHLVDEILARGAEQVRVLDNLANGRPENLEALDADRRLSLVTGDLLDSRALDEVLDGAEVVFHLACLGVRHSLHSPLENHRVNAEGTLRLLLACDARAVERFVSVSSSEVFGTAQYAPMDEAHPTWPETVYGASKLAGEAYARAAFRTSGLPAVVVRPFNTYGPRSHFEGDCGELIPRTVVRVLSGRAPVVFGDGEQTRDFLHVSDTARALADLAECDEAVGRTVNVGYGEEITVNEVCRLVADAAGRADLVPEHQEPRPGDVRRLWVDNSLVRQLIGFGPRVPFVDGVADVVRWFGAQGTSAEEMVALMTDRNWESEGARAR